MTTERLNELAKEISTWSARNFPVRESRLGIIEEIGEAAHCLLKRKQGIRGFDNEEYFKEQLADALADTAIYLLDYFGTIQVEIEGAPAIRFTLIEDPDTAILYGLIRCLTRLHQESHHTQSQAGGLVLGYLSQVGRMNGIDFYAKLEETWAKVSKRDWVLNPKDANVVAEKA